MIRKKIKILIISSELWKNGTNGGNVLSNLFEGMDAEFAQIYCSPGSPDNTICEKYYQMTDFMMINNILKSLAIGKVIEYHHSSVSQANLNNVSQENKGFYRFFSRYRLNLFFLFKELLWKLAKWDNQQLRKFIIDFEPDIIFAPCYASQYMLRITRHVANLTSKKVISYISDDNYSLRQWQFSPIYWINRLSLRRSMRKTFPYYSLTYTMTEEQLSELKTSLNANMKILRKGGGFSGDCTKTIVNKPIRMVYAGGIYCGRWKTLAYIGELLKKINRDEIKMRLDIYTQTDITPKQRDLLNDNSNIILHQPVSQTALNQIYQSSDIALHVESFEKQYKLLTRLSFSTKIVDCLASSCAVMAISWKEHSGLIYLQKEDAAICIDDPSKIEKALQEIADNPEIVIKYANKAWDCGKRNHQIESIRAGLYQDIQELVTNEI